MIHSMCILQLILDYHSLTSFLPLWKVFYPTDTFGTIISKQSWTFNHWSFMKVMISYMTSTNYLLFQKYHEIYRTNLIQFSLLKNENPQSMHLFNRTHFLNVLIKLFVSGSDDMKKNLSNFAGEILDILKKNYCSMIVTKS